MTGDLVQLEPVAPDALPAHLVDLWRSGRDRVRVSIATLPVGPHGGEARTVRPLSVWKTLFDLSGFEVTAEDFLDDTGSHAAREWSAAAHWARFDPFRGDGDPQRRVITLRRRPAAAPSPTWYEQMIQTLGVRRPAPIRPARLTPGAHLVFLVGTYQEFRQYHPLWAELPASAFTVLLRDGGSETGWIRRRQCMEAWLSVRGIDWRAVSDVSKVRWDDWPHEHRALIVGADSTMFRSHVLNGAFVVSARAQRWKTIQLQHGIWPYADATAPMTMMSEVMLTWSREFKSGLDEVVTWPDGTVSRRGLVAETRFVTAGCPAFDRYADPFWPKLDDLLGDWVARYRRRVLVATNLHWSQHRSGALVNPALIDLARRHEDTLFIVKTHPAHDPDDAFMRACPPNVQVLDELCCLFADLDAARLVLAADAVICTLSTVALEAALAGRPFILLDTGNPNSYMHVKPVPLDRLSEAYASLFDTPADREAFVDHYLGSGLVGRATRAVIDAIAVELTRPSSPLRDPLAMRSFVEVASIQGAEAFALQARISELESSLSAATAANAAQQRQLNDARRREALLGECLRERDGLYAASLARRAKVGLFGASAAGVQRLAELQVNPTIDIHGFFDNDPARWGTRVAGLPVMKPGRAAFESIDLIVISSMHVEAIARQVIEAGYGRKLVLDPSLLTISPATSGAAR